MTKSQSREQGEKDDPSKGAACMKVAEVCPETRAHDGAGWGEKKGQRGMGQASEGWLAALPAAACSAGVTKYVHGGEQVCSGI